MEEYILSDRKRIPYGIMNFDGIRIDDYYYDRQEGIHFFNISFCHKYNSNR